MPGNSAIFPAMLAVVEPAHSEGHAAHSQHFSAHCAPCSQPVRSNAQGAFCCVESRRRLVEAALFLVGDDDCHALSRISRLVSARCAA